MPILSAIWGSSLPVVLQRRLMQHRTLGFRVAQILAWSAALMAAVTLKQAPFDNYRDAVVQIATWTALAGITLSVPRVEQRALLDLTRQRGVAFTPSNSGAWLGWSTQVLFFFANKVILLALLSGWFDALSVRALCVRVVTAALLGVLTTASLFALKWLGDAANPASPNRLLWVVWLAPLLLRPAIAELPSFGSLARAGAEFGRGWEGR